MRVCIQPILYYDTFLALCPTLRGVESPLRYNIGIEPDQLSETIMSYLENEIFEQPSAITRLLGDERDNVDAIAATIREYAPQFVMIAARGTSDNAARYAKYLMGIQAKWPVVLATPSVHTLYETAPTMHKALVIGISQSGQSEDVRKVIADANAQGALTLGITNHPESPLAQLAQHHIYLRAGDEKSVAATKTYTTELAAIAWLTQAVLQDEAGLKLLNRLAGWMQQTLEGMTHMDWIQRYRYAEHLAVLGRGYNYCTAFEISLKIKELCYITSEEYSEADFRHGPIAIVSQGFPVVMVAPIGKTLSLMRDLLDQLHDKGAERIIISNDEATRATAEYSLPFPADVPEWLSPLCAVIPGQMLAYRLAEIKGHDLDQPRGLNKVTNTT